MPRSETVHSDTEVVIGNPADPDAIVRMDRGKYRVIARPGLRLTVRGRTGETPAAHDPMYLRRLKA